MTDDQEHELFERVQRGNPLTHAEKSQAKKGEWQQLARSFQEDFLRVSNCKFGFSQPQVSFEIQSSYSRSMTQMLGNSIFHFCQEFIDFGLDLAQSYGESAFCKSENKNGLI